MTRKTKSAKNPESVSPWLWLLPAGALLALGTFLLWPAEVSAPAVAASVLAVRDRPQNAPSPRPDPAPALVAAAPELAPPAPPAPAGVSIRHRRGPDDAPWPLPIVGLPPDPAWRFTAEQQAQFERLSQAFLAATADPAITPAQWAQARAASDADFRILFGATLYSDQRYRVALRGAQSSTSDPLPTPDQP